MMQPIPHSDAAPLLGAAETDPETVLRRFAAAPAVVVACDFDGTLAPLTLRHADARILPDAEAALVQLQELPGTTVAIVTGRSIVGLQRTGVRTAGRFVAGSHGAEVMTETREPTPEEQAQRNRIVAGVRLIAARTDGVDWEEKPYAVTIHVRRVEDPARAELVLDELAALAAELSTAGLPVTMRAGKDVRELSVRPSDKGQIVQRFQEERPDGLVLFIGDDRTDEDAFARLRPQDLGVWVGPEERQHLTAARYRVDDPPRVAELLGRLASWRARDQR